MVGYQQKRCRDGTMMIVNALPPPEHHNFDAIHANANIDENGNDNVVVHIIPCENDEPACKKLKSSQNPTNYATCETSEDENETSLSSSTMFQDITMYQDALLALEDVKALTQTIGSSVVMNQAMLVNQRVFHVQNRQRIMAAKKLKSQTSSASNDDENEFVTGDEETSSLSSAAISEDSSTSANDETNNAFSEEERQSILQQACRMKRMTNMFRTLQKLQDMLVRDVYSCMIDEEIAATNATCNE
jgi:hypothetical protein